MPLSAAENKKNEMILTEIGDDLVRLYGDEIKTDFDGYRLATLNLLNENNLMATIESGLKKLRQLFQKSIQDFVALAQFEQQLQAWLKDYRSIEAQATADLLELAEQQGTGIVHSLMYSGDVLSVWGTDADIRDTLKNQLTYPDQVTAGVHILPPVSIVPGQYAAEEERKNPHHALLHHLKSAIARSDQCEINVLIPVVSSDTHWRLFSATLKDKQIMEAVLIDSQSNQGLKKSTAFKNAEAAVKAIDPLAKLKTKALNCQTNGHSCMDFTVQTALKTLPQTVVVDDKLKHIRDAANEKTLRAAVIDKIIENRPDIAAKRQTRKMEDVFKQKAEALPANVLESDIFTAFTKLDGQAAENVAKAQIKFDEMMAAKLAELYQSAPKQHEAVLLQQARVHAYQSMQKEFGLFADKDRARSKMAQSKSATTSKRSARK